MRAAPPQWDVAPGASPIPGVHRRPAVSVGSPVRRCAATSSCGRWTEPPRPCTPRQCRERVDQHRVHEDRRHGGKRYADGDRRDIGIREREARGCTLCATLRPCARFSALPVIHRAGLRSAPPSGGASRAIFERGSFCGQGAANPEGCLNIHKSARNVPTQFPPCTLASRQSGTGGATVPRGGPRHLCSGALSQVRGRRNGTVARSLTEVR